MIRQVSVWHGKDGYTLRITDVPIWAWCADALNNAIIGVICSVSKGWACPLCLCSRLDWTFRIGWGKDPDGHSRYSLGGLLFKLGQRGGRFHLNREREVYSRPLTFEEVCEHFPDKRVEFDDDGVDYARGVMVMKS